MKGNRSFYRLQLDDDPVFRDEGQSIPCLQVYVAMGHRKPNLRLEARPRARGQG